MEHSKTPWKLAYRGSEGAYDIDVQHSRNWDVSIALNVNEADARRIVACVNACEGIPTAMLEQMALGGESLMPRYASLSYQRDQLAEALRSIAELRDFQKENWSSPNVAIDNAACIARAALAAIEEE